MAVIVCRHYITKTNGQCGSKSMTSDDIQLVVIFIRSSLTLRYFPKYLLGKRSEESKGWMVPNLVWIQTNIPDPARNLDPIINSAVLSVHWLCCLGSKKLKLGANENAVLLHYNFSLMADKMWSKYDILFQQKPKNVPVASYPQRDFSWLA